MIEIKIQDKYKMITVDRGYGLETFLVNAKISDALICHIFKQSIPVKNRSLDDLTEDELRAKAKAAGLKNWHKKKRETMLAELGGIEHGGTDNP